MLLNCGAGEDFREPIGQQGDQADSLPAEPQGKPKTPGVGNLSLLQWIFLTQELNWCFLHCRQILYQLRKSVPTQKILKEINPEYLLEGLMLKLKLQYFGHLMRRADSLEKTLMLGKMEGRRRRG